MVTESVKTRLEKIKKDKEAKKGISYSYSQILDELMETVEK